MQQLIIKPCRRSLEPVAGKMIIQKNSAKIEKIANTF